MRSTKAIIHLENLESNIREIKRFLEPQTKLLVAVKANAYGHGMLECARTAIKSGADYLAIATVEEGIELRNNRIKAPLLMLSLCSLDEISDVVKYRITPFVFDEEYIDLLSEECRKKRIRNFPVHLAVDSGMGRIGCHPEEAPELAKKILSTGYLSLGGMATHFAVSDSKTEAHNQYTALQFQNFKNAIEGVKAAGINPGICHCCNSAATLDHPEMHLDMVRPGIIVYGYDADQVNSRYLAAKGTPITLKPVMTLETEVCAIRHMKKGSTIGYGRTWTAEEDTDIAVLPIGYGDGFLRRNSTQGFKVSINGKAYPICGRICMDQCMVNIGNDSGIKRWERAILFGAMEDGALQTADDVAALTGTISYEVTTAISHRVERIYTE